MNLSAREFADGVSSGVNAEIKGKDDGQAAEPNFLSPRGGMPPTPCRAHIPQFRAASDDVRQAGLYGNSVSDGHGLTERTIKCKFASREQGFSRS
jgi:hypothetical protein